jgi:SAM-dependent methyltransferase
LDWFDTEDLRLRHADNPKIDPHDLVHVDHVVNSRDFAESVRRRVDLVIANHVIEHVPDPIHWLSEAGRCVETGGLLLLSVPDRRYTFDFFRRESDAVDMVTANREARERATVEDVARHLYYWNDVAHADVWEKGPPIHFKPRMPFGEALIRAAALSEQYTDVHCWVFTTESFLRTFDALRASGHIAWDIVAFEDVQPGQNEMRVLLRRD